jgi:hypothetical protein
MHTGNFRLERTTLAVGELNGKPVAVTIPAGEVIKMILKPSDGNTMVDVLWKGRAVAVYAVDLQQRGRDTVSTH